MAELITKNGYIVSVDDEDFNLLEVFDWYATYTKGGWGIFTRSIDGSSLIPMARLLLNPPNELVIDHYDGNHFNMRRDNLVLMTQCQNMQKANYSKSTNGASKYRGVGKDKSGTKWHARIRTGSGKRISLGTFTDEIQAALAYDRAALKYYGTTAAINFPVGGMGGTATIQ